MVPVATKRDTLTSPYTPYDLDYLLHVTPSDTVLSPLRDAEMRGMPSAKYFTSPPSTGRVMGLRSAPLQMHLEESSEDETDDEIEEEEEEEEEDPVNHQHPLIQDIRAKEVRFSSTASGNPLKPTLRELPLRGFRSQENLSGTTTQPIDSVLKRSSTIHETSTAVTSPSVYSPQQTTTTSQLINAISSVSEPAAQASIQHKPPTLIYDNHDSAFISPPPIMSATPSPLFFNRAANEQKPAHFQLLQSHEQPPSQPQGAVPSRQRTPPPLTFATVSGPEPDFPYLPSPGPSEHSTATAPSIAKTEPEIDPAITALPIPVHPGLSALPASPSPHPNHLQTNTRSRSNDSGRTPAPLKLFPQADLRLQAHHTPRSPRLLEVPIQPETKTPRSPWRKVLSPFGIKGKRRKSKSETISQLTATGFLTPDIASRTSIDTDRPGISSQDNGPYHHKPPETPLTSTMGKGDVREQRLSPLVEIGLLPKTAMTNPPHSPAPFASTSTLANATSLAGGVSTAYSASAATADQNRTLGGSFNSGWRGHRKSRSERLAPLLNMGMLDTEAARRKSEETERPREHHGDGGVIGKGGVGGGWMRTPLTARPGDGRPF